VTDNISEEIALSLDSAAAREDEGGSRAYRFVISRAGKSYSSADQIEKNVIGERVLGYRMRSTPIGSPPW
jgi:hypothetical protein